MKVRDLIRELAKCDPDAEVELGEDPGPGRIEGVYPYGSGASLVFLDPEPHDTDAELMACGKPPSLQVQARHVLEAIGAAIPKGDPADWHKSRHAAHEAMQQAVERALGPFGFSDVRCRVNLVFPETIDGLEPIGLPHMRAHVKLTGAIEGELWIEGDTPGKFPTRIE